MYSKGISWIDDCRIPTTEILGREQKSTTNYALLQGGYNDGFWDNTKGLGRFPANILVSDDMLNDGVISKSKSGGISSGVNFGGETTKYRNRTGHDDKGSNSRYYNIDKWFDKILND